jgi:hypothetical protein
MARLLTGLGIPCGHEAIFDWHGYNRAKTRMEEKESLKCSMVSCANFVNGEWHAEPKWVEPNEIVAESSYMAAPFLDKPILSGVAIVHVVRNPIRVINSFSNYLGYFKCEESMNEYEQFIYSHLPELQKTMAPCDRAALFYILWNELIDSKETFFYRIEDDVDQLLDFLGIQGGACYNNTSVNTHRKVGRRFVFSDIQSSEIAQRLVIKCEEYGYAHPNNMVLLA